MVATHRLWRWLPDGRLETVEVGERCDWTADGVYEHLGWATDVAD